MSVICLFNKYFAKKCQTCYWLNLLMSVNLKLGLHQ